MIDTRSFLALLLVLVIWSLAFASANIFIPLDYHLVMGYAVGTISTIIIYGVFANETND